jgi:hypothetical protein
VRWTAAYIALCAHLIWPLPFAEVTGTRGPAREAFILRDRL